MTRHARHCSADRLRKLQTSRRYAVLVCFLWQIYRDTIDHIIDMYDKLITRIYNRAQGDIDEHMKSLRRSVYLRTNVGDTLNSNRLLPILIYFDVL